MESLEEIEDYELVVKWNDAGKCIKLDELQSVHSKFDKMGPILRPQQLFNHKANN
jgi:hypothetical protein